MYIKEPMKIEDKGMGIIDSVMGDISFSDEEMLATKRMIHTIGDFEYRRIVIFKDDFLEEAKVSIEKGTKIFTDIGMAYQRINKPALEKSFRELVYHIDDDDVREAAKAKGITRSIYVLEKAVGDGVRGFVIGNASTALFRLIELTKGGKVDPNFVVGIPVDFAGATESEEALREVEIASIPTVRTKDGSNVAASITNALLYMVYSR